MVGIPDVHHAVGVDVGCFDLAAAQQFMPIKTKPFECGIGICGNQIPGDEWLCSLLVEDQGIRRIKFLFARIFLIAEKEEDLPRFAGIERNLDVV